MTTVVLVRHGLTAMTGPVLAGWTPGLHLDERGVAQAAAVAERLRPVPFDAVVSSPLDRCLDTAGAVLGGRSLELQVDDRPGECRYGDWTGRPLESPYRPSPRRSSTCTSSGDVRVDATAAAVSRQRSSGLDTTAASGSGASRSATAAACA